MKSKIVIATALAATLALAACSKTENTNVSINETAVSDNSMEMNDTVANVADNASNTM